MKRARFTEEQIIGVLATPLGGIANFLGGNARTGSGGAVLSRRVLVRDDADARR